MTDDVATPVEKVSQTDMLQQFRERFNAAIEENKQLSEKIKQNEVVALKLQGAIEALEYYQDNPPTGVPTPDIPADDVASESTEIDNLTT
tara:strand:- start:8138 stop:8407 length:270 start_codon:yes stop_codon:yes gene_type:complete